MDLKQEFAVDGKQLKRFEKIYEGYKLLFNDPDNCVPMLNVSVRGAGNPRKITNYVMMDHPEEMLRVALENFQQHILIGDDCVPAFRVNFGTAQPASAFGAKLVMPTDAAPIAGSHPLKSTEEIYELKMPSVYDGIYAKLYDFIDYFVRHLPEGMYVQNPDIQSPMNTAHLVRGNEILTDFYDDPDAVHHLFHMVTQFTIDVTKHFLTLFSPPFDGWFFDWGGMWKGRARLSDCSVHMISPDMYMEFVYECDRRFLREIGGGRIHYCGEGIKHFENILSIPESSGLDFDWQVTDVFELEPICPKEKVLCQSFELGTKFGDMVMNGELKKRNVMLSTAVDTIEEAKEVYQMFKEVYTK